ncbi:MAG: DegT/DnrJ/EryC1/StrS family aminotransferase [Nitrosopumilus sp. H8]|nr:MAG: DegT/DnrJ/EryC1/StrS family aminotransferase [Nitrosopumilus sp. H8]
MALKIAINGPQTGREEISAVSSVLRDGVLTSSASQGGRRVRAFEKSAASFVKSRYAVAVSSGTAALQASLCALGIKGGDEVLVPSFTFIATANAVVSVGARPVFVDIQRDNYTMDPGDLQKKITKKTKAAIPVHVYGNVAHVGEISEITRQNNIPVVEDAAQSLGSTYKNRHTGTFFEMGCYSMYPGKVMTSGEGGFIVTKSKKLRDRLRMIRNHGMIRGYDSKMFGLNLRLPEISAAIASVQLKKLPAFLKSRKKNAAMLSEMLADLNLELPVPRRHESVNWCLYTVAASRRNKLLRDLNRKGIGAASYYTTPVHKTPFYKTGKKLPVTDWAASRVLSLPVHPGVTASETRYIARAVRGSL